MIHELVLRWVVTGLFGLSAAECGVAIIRHRRPWTLAVSHGLHFVMAVAMVLMAWPWGAQFPTAGPAVFFLLAAVWFMAMAVSASRTTAARGSYGYHGLMMLATAWMYAIMNPPASSGSPTWFSAVNWVGTVGFAVAAAFWTSRNVKQRQHKPTRWRSLGNPGQAMMAAGMAILFSATLFRV